MSEPLAMIEGEAEIQDINLEFNSETETSPVTGGIDCSVKGFYYLAGYIAHRGRKYDRTMGTSSELNLPSTSASEHGSWIEVLSQGGLIVPSDDWLSKVSQFELMFKEVNGSDGMSKEKHIVKSLCTNISTKYKEVPAEIVKIFVRTGMFICLNYMNSKTKWQKAAAAQGKKSRQLQSSSVSNEITGAV